MQSLFKNLDSIEKLKMLGVECHLSVLIICQQISSITGNIFYYFSEEIRDFPASTCRRKCTAPEKNWLY